MFAIDDPSAVAVMPTPEAAGTTGFFTEGNPALGVEATRVRSSFLNGLQQELLNILGAAAITPNKTTYDQLLTAILKIAGGSARVKGLIAANNATTPTTQFDFIASAVDMRNPTTGAVFSVTSPASKTCNISTAGPAANGRDQAGAFTASSWVHFYYIFNPTTAAIDTIASASASAPAGLPAGYTAWAYIGAVYLSASSQFMSVYMRGSWASYTALQSAISSGTATTATAVNLATLVPPNALETKLAITSMSITSTAGGNYSGNAIVGINSGAVFGQAGLSGQAAANALLAVSGVLVLIPNLNQNFSYFVQNTTGTGAAASISVSGYKLPNGGE